MKDRRTHPLFYRAIKWQDACDSNTPLRFWRARHNLYTSILYETRLFSFFQRSFFLMCVSQSRGARSRRFPKRYSTHGRAAKVAGMAGVEPAFSVPIIHVPGRNRCNYTPKKWWSRWDSNPHGFSAHNFSGYGGYQDYATRP